MDKKNNKNNTNKAIIIVLIIGFIFLIANIIYNKKNHYEDWVVCEYSGESSILQETVKFRYIYDRMYGYYENRVMDIVDESNHKEALESVQNFGKDFKNSDDLKYVVEEDGTKIKTTFYIKALDYYEFINQYFQDEGITIDSTPKEVIEKMGSSYKCTIK